MPKAKSDFHKPENGNLPMGRSGWAGSDRRAIPAMSGSSRRAAGEHHVLQARELRLGVSLHSPLLLKSRPLPFLHRVQQIPWLGNMPGDNTSASVRAGRQGRYQSSRMLKDEVLEAAAEGCVWPVQLCSKLGEVPMWDRTQQQPQACSEDQSEPWCLWGDTSTRFFLLWAMRRVPTHNFSSYCLRPLFNYFNDGRCTEKNILDNLPGSLIILK